MATARLVLERTGAACALAQGPRVAGRLQSCDVVLVDEPQSSRRHFEVAARGTRWCVRDLGSRNGTLLNGVRLAGERPLQHGDRIAVGTSVVRYEASPAPLSGRRLGGCELGRSLGRSRYGTLYQGTQPNLSRQVVVEAVDPDLAGDPVFRKGYEQQARLAGALDHPSLRAVFDTGVADGVLYSVLEALPGRPLGERFAAGPLKRAESLMVLGGVARALCAIHDRGRHHGALTSDAVWVDDAARVKLAELGTADRLDPFRSDAELQAAFASPEEARGQLATSASDVYALGVLAFRLLCGRFAYEGAPAAVLKQHAATEPVAIPGSLDAATATLLADLLTKDPARRPSADGAAQALAALAGGGSAPAAGRSASGRSSGRTSGRRSATSSARLRQLASSGRFEVLAPMAPALVATRAVLVSVGYALIAIAATLGTRVVLRLVTG